MTTPRLDVQMLTPWADPSQLGEQDRRALPWTNGGFYVSTGAACNQNCRYCFLDERRFAPWDEVAGRVRLARQLGFDHAFLIGGEPLIYPRLDQLIDLMADSGVRGWGVMTNGLVLAERARLDDLVARGARLFQLSFDSHRPEVQNHLARNADLSTALAAAFENLGRHSGLLVAVSAVVTRANIDDLDAYVRHVASLRASVGLEATIMLAQMKPSDRADADLMVPMAETATAVRAAVDTGAEVGVDVRCRLLPRCLIEGYESHATDLMTRAMTVDASGHATQPPETETRHTERCQGCAVRERCSGPLRSYVQRFGDRELRAL